MTSSLLGFQSILWLRVSRDVPFLPAHPVRRLHVEDRLPIAFTAAGGFQRQFTLSIKKHA